MKNVTLTDDEIRVIAERADAAAAGPWSGTDATRDVAYWGIGRREAMVLGPQGYSVLSDNDERRQPVAENAIFIAAARTDVPRLCAELLAARSLAKVYRESYYEMCTVVTHLQSRAASAERERGEVRAEVRQLVARWRRAVGGEARAHVRAEKSEREMDEARRVLGELVEALNGCKVYYRHEVSVASGRRNFNDALAAARALVGEAKDGG